MTPSRAITNVNKAVEHDRAGAEWTPFVVMFLACVLVENACEDELVHYRQASYTSQI